LTAQGQRGFSLVEVLAVAALTIGVMLAASAAVLRALHGVASSDVRMLLEDDALNALTDIRAATAYGDPTAGSGSASQIEQLIGKSSTATNTLPGGGIETLTLSISNSATGPIATATASTGAISVTEQQALFVEAPTPGSVVDVSPAPSPQSPSQSQSP
jgi:type II secretory pathway pseudopilin PulG